MRFVLTLLVLSVCVYAHALPSVDCSVTPDHSSCPPPVDYGWSELPDTKLRSVCPPNDFNGSGYNFRYYCKSVIEAWSGGTFDTYRNRMYIWGGGHGDYLGNEIYALDLDALAFERLTDPAVPKPKMAAGVIEHELTPYDGTQPNGRHTYDVVNYMPNHDVVMAWSGSLTSVSGGADNWTWIFDPKTNTWKHDPATGEIPKGIVAAVSDYNPLDGFVYVQNRNSLYRYEYKSDGGVWSRAGKASNAPGLGLTAVIDPDTQRFYAFGVQSQYYYPLNSGTSSMVKISTTGWDDLSSTRAPGLLYDPTIKKIVGLGKFGDLYYLDQNAMVWEKKSFPNSPVLKDKNGTFGRFSYSPKLDAYVAYGNVDSNGYVFKPVRDDVLSVPNRPLNLTAEDKHYRTVLAWDKATSEAGVQEYIVTRDGIEIGRTSLLIYPDDLVTVGTYQYTITAVDATGQTGPESDAVTAIVTETPNTVLLSEPFEDKNWWKNGWNKSHSKTKPVAATDAQTSTIVSDDCVSGSCLAVVMKEGALWSMSLAYPFPDSPEEVFLSYDIKMGVGWTPDMCADGVIKGAGGKFPGLADPRAWPETQCGNGGNSSDGINCWTARTQYGRPLISGNITRLGSYVYHPNQNDHTGDAGYWDDNPKASSNGMKNGVGQFNNIKTGEWSHIETQVRMNTPGYRNGILRAWINGNLAYEKTNMEFRKLGHDNLHVRLLWFDVYKGGTLGNCATGNVYFDNLKASTGRAG